MYHALGEEGELASFDFPTMCVPPKSASSPDLKFYPFGLLWKSYAEVKPFIPRSFLLLLCKTFPSPVAGFEGTDHSQLSDSISFYCSMGAAFWLPLQGLCTATGFCISCLFSPDPRGPSVSCSYCSHASGPGLGGLGGREWDLQSCALYPLKTDTAVQFCKALAVLSPRDIV